MSLAPNVEKRPLGDREVYVSTDNVIRLVNRHDGSVPTSINMQKATAIIKGEQSGPSPITTTMTLDAYNEALVSA